jgi:acetate kinase
MLLVLNAGSSSIKFALYTLPLDGPPAWPRPRVEGQIAGIGRKASFVVARKILPVPGAVEDHDQAIARLLDWLEAEGHARKLEGAGHRVVHGGGRFVEPLLLDSDRIEALSRLIALAPLHQPHNIAAIRALAARAPRLRQVACFDTAFHAAQPEEAYRLPLPRDFRDRGLRRYGFHGLSYESILAQLPDLTGVLPRRLIVAHLGQGASLCAILAGRSLATTMGFSTLDGLIMGTRPGSLDPGVLLHLLREGSSPAEIEDLLYHRSGLLALSGISADMKTLLESAEPAALSAVRQYCYRISRELGSLAAALEGVDALVFTGGIGENAPAIRAQVCRAAAWLGIEMDKRANAAGGPRLTTRKSAVAVWRIDTDEQAVIARRTAKMLRLQ